MFLRCVSWVASALSGRKPCTYTELPLLGERVLRLGRGLIPRRKWVPARAWDRVPEFWAVRNCNLAFARKVSRVKSCYCKVACGRPLPLAQMLACPMAIFPGSLPPWLTSV